VAELAECLISSVTLFGRRKVVEIEIGSSTLSKIIV
jgi:hypothetical protein